MLHYVAKMGCEWIEKLPECLKLKFRNLHLCHVFLFFSRASRSRFSLKISYIIQVNNGKLLV